MKTLIIVCLLSSCLLRTTTTTKTTGSEENSNSNSNNVIVAVVNETVTFDCDDHVGDHILWKKRVTTDVTTESDVIYHQNLKTFPIDEAQVTLRKRHRRNKHTGTGKLRLGEVSVDDAGTYSCHSWKRDRVSLKSWTLIVLDLSKVSHSIFYEGVPLKNGTVIIAQEGDSISLTCLSRVSTAKIDSAAKWKTSSVATSSFKVYSWPDKHRGTDNEHSSAFNESLVAQTITLDPLERAENPLNFECESATNTQIVTVDVNFPPTFTIRRVPGFGIPVVEGMRISLLCEVDKKKNFATSDPRWLKDEKPISASNLTSGGLLLFDRISSDDIGWYQCTIEHDGETYSSIGYFLNVKSASFENTPSSEEDLDGFNMTYNSHDFVTSSADSKEVSTRSSSLVQEQPGKSLVAGRVSYEERSPDQNQLRSDCNGCCLGLRTGLRDLQDKLEYYQYGGGGPKISQSDQSRDDEVSVIICASFQAEKIFWITPSQRVVRPGSATPDGYTASHIVVLNDTCVTATLSVKSVDGVTPENDEVVIIAKNRYGMTEFSLKLLSTASSQQDSNVISAEISSSHRHTFNLVYTSISVVIHSLLLYYK